MTDPRHEQYSTPEELRSAAAECERAGRWPRADRLRRRADVLEAYLAETRVVLAAAELDAEVEGGLWSVRKA